MMKTKQSKAVAYLQSGVELTAKQIKATFKVKNPYDVIYKMRKQGLLISADKHRLSRGDLRKKYSLKSNIPIVSN